MKVNAYASTTFPFEPNGLEFADSFVGHVEFALVGFLGVFALAVDAIVATAVVVMFLVDSHLILLDRDPLPEFEVGVPGGRRSSLIRCSKVPQSLEVMLPPTIRIVQNKANIHQCLEALGRHEALDDPDAGILAAHGRSRTERIVVAVDVVGVADSGSCGGGCQGGVHRAGGPAGSRTTLGRRRQVLLQDLVVVALPLGPIGQVGIGQIPDGNAPVTVFLEKVPGLFQTTVPSFFVVDSGFGNVGKGHLVECSFPSFLLLCLGLHTKLSSRTCSVPRVGSSSGSYSCSARTFVGLQR